MTPLPCKSCSNEFVMYVWKQAGHRRETIWKLNENIAGITQNWLRVDGDECFWKDSAHLLNIFERSIIKTFRALQPDVFVYQKRLDDSSFILSQGQRNIVKSSFSYRDELL